MMADLLTVKDLTKQYQEFTLGPLSFNVPAGYILGMIGPNGAGKTTTLRLLLDMAAPTAGTVTLNGDTTPAARALARAEVGVALDTTGFPESWRVADVDSAMALFLPNWDAARFHELIDLFGVAKKTAYKKLSRGTQAKVNLAAALSHDAKLVILDEPAAGLDPIARDQLMTLLQAYIEDGQHSVILSSHITGDLARIADYLLYIVGGHQLFFGETATLLDRYVLVKGGRGKLTPELKKLGLGLRETAVGFSLMMRAEAARNLPAGLTIEPVDLDALMIYYGKEVQADAQ
ncbi:ABC transporter ATP-binding protein [Lacticaseibacillus yichunensis]|uniref:ABC transporter ATP-binding protein n=2 Tax=Lacticaseibacillus yichunensis TaxID=2486015 RepID=A0ABW4CRH4_9LACO